MFSTFFIFNICISFLPFFPSNFDRGRRYQQKRSVNDKKRSVNDEKMIHKRWKTTQNIKKIDP